MKAIVSFVKERPWIWLIVGNLAIIAALTTLGVIAQKHAHQFAPVVRTAAPH